MSLSYVTNEGMLTGSHMSHFITPPPPVKDVCGEAAWCLSPTFVGNGHSIEDALLLNDTFLNQSIYSIDHVTEKAAPSSYDRAANILRREVLFGICIIGVIGNVLNLLFMTPRIVRGGNSMGRITQYSYAGMITLALSDLTFCILGSIPLVIDGLRRTVCHLSGSTVYHAYSIALYNLFVLESTWLTVAMAAGRYLAICHPFRAKQWIGMKMFWKSILMLTLLCIAFNIPRFWTYEIATYNCNGTVVYHLQHGYLKRHPTFETAYGWAYFVLGIVIPLVILTYCNIFLIKALRSINNNGPSMPAGLRNQESTRHITLTFVAIIIIYIILVTPAEVIGFIRKLIITRVKEKQKYNMLVDILNVLQALNFSMNFVVYCIINKSFRNSVLNTLKCIIRPGSQINNTDIYTSVTTNTTTMNGRQSFMLADHTPRASLVWIEEFLLTSTTGNSANECK